MITMLDWYKPDMAKNYRKETQTKKTALKSIHPFESYDATDRHWRQTYDSPLLSQGLIKVKHETI